MANYFKPADLKVMDEVRKKIYILREEVWLKYMIDILDTDALSALTIYQIISQYDSDYNINFARNGEDAKSNETLIECKAARVAGPLTKTGKPRKGAGTDAFFLFHAMGDIEHSRYIFVARNKDNLEIVRLYDISTKSNCKIVADYLLGEREKWLAKSKKDKNQMKRDIISISEKFIVENLILPTTLTIANCLVHKD